MFDIVRAVRYLDKADFVFFNEFNKFIEHVTDNECLEERSAEIWNRTGFLIYINFLIETGCYKRGTETELILNPLSITIVSPWVLGLAGLSGINGRIFFILLGFNLF